MISIPQCSYCSQSISGKYFKDYWGNNYHADHLKNVPSCDYCGRLISKHLTNGGTSYSDGRKICALCIKTAVDNDRKGKQILQIVHDELSFIGINISPFKPEFYLIDRSRLKSLAGKTEKQGFARFEKESVNGNVKSFKLQIYILKGLPESSFITAAAHELMHIWFYSRNITDLSPGLEEGSCNFAAYLLLNTMNTPESAYRIHELFEDKSPTYGKGFKKIHKMVQSKGITFWLKYIQSHKKLIW